ncbi:MATE family efflux transporter [Butyricicoccus faecihominis]|uniref:MATE family efflux transporter n=1 Tax=Butyricicoccus faecihominis TaxID=1712515 RepID=UPI00247A33FE|nr:MATE family efflux transporter [Butyricicoccus faecihominis]MCQ5131002.1 MATE family efflux transporter [Butyricicoccus faecihominis]
MEQNDRFLNQTFRRFLWPTVLSVLGGTVNVMVDSVIIGNLLGANGLAAISLCTPVYLLLCTLGSLIATGAGIRSAVAIGRAGAAAGRRDYTLAFYLLLASGLLFSALGLCLLDPLTAFLGAAGAVRPLAAAYLRVTLIGGVCKVLLYLPFQYLRLDGRPGLVTGLMLAMTALNAALDLLFMAGCGWGMAGAAAASVLATAVAVAAGMGFLHQRASAFHLQRFSFSAKEIAAVLRIGSPAALNNLLSAARLIVLNRIFLGLGGSALVAVFTMVNSMGEFSLALVSGVPQTAAPLLGVYGGERDTASIRRLLRRQFDTGERLIAVCALASAVCARQLCTLFGLTGAAALSVGAPALRLFALSLPFAMAGGILISFYNTAGHIALANALTAARIFLFAAGPAALLAAFAPPGLVWLFYPLSELLTLSVWPLLAALVRRGRRPLSRFYLLDESLERQGHSLNFSVASDPAGAADASERITAFCEQNKLSPKITMAVSLSIEELLTVIRQNCFDGDETQYADVRVFCLPGTVGLRIRHGGRMFDPLRWYREAGEDAQGDALGVRLITGLAQAVTWQRTFGVNTLIVIL